MLVVPELALTDFPAWIEETLPRVERPSRYLGVELNSVHKDPARVDLRVCLAFPDSYDLGLGNLGLQILYGILNREPDVWAERVCAPHPDLEAELRRQGRPLFSLESKTPLAAFDLLGFTLQWELTYTNLLNMLDLGGVPVFANERDDTHPIVAAGGPCAFNPEPLALFIDVFVIGDGEEAVLDLARAVQAGGGRTRILERLAATPGCYVPALAPTQVSPRGWVVPAPGAPRVTRRLVRDLDAALAPLAPIVSFAEQVHDRASLEVLRGCTQGCRFCQAGMVTRPVRERSLATLATQQQAVMAATGHEELGLVSLSTCDHSRVKALVAQSVALGASEHVAVSLPSLRLDSFSVDLAGQVGGVRKTGLTFAPEAATDRLRRVINKTIPTEDLLETTRACYAQGWQVLKLYFMIGLPTETDEDVTAIADLAREVLDLGRRLQRKARVNLGVSTFVPKALTPLQWAELIPPDEVTRRQKLLFAALGRNPNIKFGRHDTFATWLEGLLGRNDRLGGWLVYHAWREGARFDGWTELLDRGAWERAVERWEREHGRAAADLLAARALDEPLPWDHLDTLVSKEWLAADYQRALAGEHAPDCRRGKCHECGVIHVEREACAAMLRQARQGAREEAEVVLTPAPRAEAPPPIGRMRLRWGRVGPVRLVSHHELLNVFIRAIRRAGLPLRYSEGFHPHASLSFSTALKVGVETEGDWCDVTLTAVVDPAEFVARLNATLPAGFQVYEAWLVGLDERPLMAVLNTACYRALVPRALVPDDLAQRLAAYLARSEILVSRRGKERERVVWRPVDIRPMIRALSFAPGVADEPVVCELTLVADSAGRVPKVDEVLGSLLDLEPDELSGVRVRKLGSYTRVGDELVPPRPPRPEE